MTYDVATYRNAIVNDVFESPNILFTLSRRSAQRRGSAASVAYLITGFFSSKLCSERRLSFVSHNSTVYAQSQLNVGLLCHAYDSGVAAGTVRYNQQTWLAAWRRRKQPHNDKCCRTDCLEWHGSLRHYGHWTYFTGELGTVRVPVEKKSLIQLYSWSGNAAEPSCPRRLCAMPHRTFAKSRRQ